MPRISGLSRLAVASVVLAAWVTGPAVAEEWGFSIVEFAQEAIGRLGGTEQPCEPAEVDALGPGEIIICALLPRREKAFKKLWRSVAHGRARPKIFLEPQTAWLVEGPELHRYYRSDIVPIGVVYQPTTRYLKIIWTDLIYCKSDEWRSVAKELPRCGDVSEPVARGETECPTKAKKRKKRKSTFYLDGESRYGLGGSHDTTVEIEAIVLADGNVGRMCIAKTIHKDFAFIFSFTTGVRRRTYKPAETRGQPVAVVIEDDYWMKTGY